MNWHYISFSYTLVSPVMGLWDTYRTARLPDSGAADGGGTPSGHSGLRPKGH